MIRPFTLVCMVSAFGSGLYLYQSKHQAQVLDREITRTMKQAEATRERTGMLRAEWAVLNEPDRLAELAKAHTSLETLRPTQFVALGDLAARLPGPVAPTLERLPAAAEPEEPAPVAQAAPPAPAPAKPKDVASAPEPKPKPEAKPVAVAEAKPAIRHLEKPVAVRPETPAPVQVAEPAHARPAPPPVVASTEATAPGTVGAAVLRAMRAREGGAYAQPTSASSAPAYAQPAYAQPSYAPPAYAQPAYAAPAPSVLGGRSALPPPVPFAAR